MTKKLYYDDAYIKEFSAKVLSVTECDGGFEVVLDRTAFFPEEGGQSSDRGYIDSGFVSHVYEEGGVVHHITDKAPLGKDVTATLLFDERFEKMQQHTAEHILCGIIHKLFGFDNVGFHLGEGEVTFDVNGVMTREMLDEAERLANEAVFSNLDVTAYFPSAEELKNIDYRAKLELTENVRLVKIGDVDTCACCAPHVAKTGEIGLIKVLDFMKHRGGTRIWLAAGRRALSDYRNRYENVLKISSILCAPQGDVASALEKYVKDTEDIKRALKESRAALAENMAYSVPVTEGNRVVVLDGFSIDELRAFSNIAKEKVRGFLVALSAEGEEYKYVISSGEEISQRIKEINAALKGKGGGRGNMAQGSFCVALEKIEAYFS